MKFKKYEVIQTPIKAIQNSKESKVIQTLEGEVIANVGDYVVTGVNGEQYPVSKETFERKYEKVNETTYRKKKGQVKAFQLEDDISITLSDNRGVLSGKTGDFLVTSPSEYEKFNGSDLDEIDVWVVNEEIFPKLYQI